MQERCDRAFFIEPIFGLEVDGVAAGNVDDHVTLERVWNSTKTALIEELGRQRVDHHPDALTGCNVLKALHSVAARPQRQRYTAFLISVREFDGSTLRLWNSDDIEQHVAIDQARAP